MSSDSSDGPDDQELVQRARRGDQEAFTLLFHRYKESLRGYISYRVKNYDDVQDIVQQTFEKAYRQLPMLDAGAAFRGWLYTIAKNTISDYLRAKQRRPTLPFRDSPQEDREDIDAIVEEYAILVELLVLAWKETQRTLTDIQTRCLFWHYKGIEIEEIARRLNLSERTVKTYLSKGYPLFRKAYRQLQSSLEAEE